MSLSWPLRKNEQPQFSDEECITVYLWGISQRRFEQKAIYEYTRNHLLELFPKLPSYQAFSDRLNKLAPAFQALAEHWLSVIGVNLQEHMEYIMDSCRSSCPKVLAPDMQRLLVNYARKAIIPL